MEERIVELFIEDFNEKGEGVAFFNDEARGRMKIVVPCTLIGDRVEAKVNKRKRRGIYKGRLEKILQKSDLRVVPKCRHTDICGGCVLQEMKYGEQLKLKEKKVFLEFEDIIIKYPVVIYSIISCRDPWFYRNKMEFSFSENAGGTKYLGLMIAGANKYVFNLECCYLASFWMSDVLNAVRKWWEHSSLQAYNYNTNEGSLRYLTMREGKNTDEKMVILTVSGEEEYILSEQELENFTKTVREGVKDDGKLSVYLRIWKIEKKKPTTFVDRLLFGKSHITEKMQIKDRGFNFKISPSSFFQPNTFQAELLYNKALELAEITKEAVVFDLYCGTGTLAMVFSLHARKVVAIELNPDSIKDAKENMKLNDINNCEMHVGDVGKVLGAAGRKPLQ